MDRTSVNYSPVRPESRAAAAWWASRLGNCHHSVGMRGVTEMSETIRLNAERQNTYDDETRDLFCQHLELLIDVLPPDGRRAVRVDWEPDKTLQAAAERAGIDLGLYDLPVKTSMLIEDGEIRVKEGYGARWLTILTAGQLTADAAVEGIDTIG